mgnify:CR=1 FL=1
MAKYKRGSLTLARQVFNTPQLVLADDLQAIAQFLVNRANGVEMDSEYVNVKDDTPKFELSANPTEEDIIKYERAINGISEDGTTGYLDVTGTLVAKHDDFNACMGFTSYEKLYSQFEKQVSMGIEKVVLNVDSGGGEARTAFEMADQFKALAVENNIPIYAYVDGLSASAAFLWSSIADEIVARPDSEIGSVGVVVRLVNNSKMLENKGITRKFITYGENKVPFDDSGEFTAKFIQSIQEKVNKTGIQFNKFIARNRNMQVEDVIATQAEVFDTEDALDVGFIDKIMTKSEFYGNYLPSKSNMKSMYFLQSEENMTKNVELNADELQELKTQLATATETKEQLTTSLAELQAEHDVTKEQLEVMKVELAEVKEAKENLEAEKVKAELDARVAQRTAKLEASLGKDNEQVATLLASTQTLSDEQFDVIAKSLEVKQETQEKQFAEIGGEGQDSVKQLTLEEQLAQTAEKMSKKA